MTDLGIFLTTHIWMLHAIATIALVAIFGASSAIVACFERIRTQGPLQNRRAFAQDLVPGLRRNVQC